MKALIEAAELHDLVQKGRVKMVDATYGIPGWPQSAIAGMERARIDGAVFFNIDSIADPKAVYPHTLPSADDFARAVGDLGIGNDDHIVVYDQTGISFAASRAWWMFRVFGHDNVQVLNGGLPAWQAQGYATLSGPLSPVTKPRPFKATFRPQLYRSMEQVEDALDANSEVVVDARAQARFDAVVRNADGEAAAAHMPGSVNLPYGALLDERGHMKPADHLKATLGGLAASDKPLVASCGSGVTACVLALGLHEIGRPNVAIFDGSWTEYSDRHALR